jgi:hypothetical protein
MMVPYFIQHLDEIGFDRLAEFFGILDKTFHAVEAGFVKRFQHVERSKEKSARTAGGVEDGNAVAELLIGSFRDAPDDGLPDGAQ